MIQATDTENLWIVGAGVIPQDPVSLLAGPNADAVFEGLRRVADIVVCDAPPVLPVADASVLAEESDAVLFVHDPSISNRTALEDAVRQLKTAGGTIIGGVYNNISAAQRNYLGYASYDEYYRPGPHVVPPGARPTFPPWPPKAPPRAGTAGSRRERHRTSQQAPGGRFVDGLQWQATAPIVVERGLLGRGAPPITEFRWRPVPCGAHRTPRPVRPPGDRAGARGRTGSAALASGSHDELGDAVQGIQLSVSRPEAPTARSCAPHRSPRRPPPLSDSKDHRRGERRVSGPRGRPSCCHHSTHRNRGSAKKASMHG